MHISARAYFLKVHFTPTIKRILYCRYEARKRELEVRTSSTEALITLNLIVKASSSLLGPICCSLMFTFMCPKTGTGTICIMQGLTCLSMQKMRTANAVDMPNGRESLLRYSDKHETDIRPLSIHYTKKSLQAQFAQLTSRHYTCSFESWQLSSPDLILQDI